MKLLALALSSILAFFGFSFHQKNAESAVLKTCTACDALTGTEKIVCLADEFKATLSASQITTLEPSRTLANAAKWSNLPVGLNGRLGLRFADLSATQLAAAKAVIQAALGTSATEGWDEMQQLWAADQYLATNGGGSGYGSGLYFIAFLGGASLSGTWELQTGGHHVACSNTYSNGVLTGATPSFRGIEPFDAFASGGVNVQPMVQERDALAAMLGGLSATELVTAKLSGSFNDILLGPNKDWQFPAAKSGIKVGTLTAAQKTLVRSAIKTYVNDIDDANAAAIMATYETGLDETYISYVGGTALTAKGDYVRIDGPRVWIEYSTQNGIVLSPKHPHSVWRDHLGDYGGLGGPVSTNSAASFDGKFNVFPNPTSDVSTIEIEVEKAATVTVSLFDSAGKRVAEGLKIQVTAGEHRFPIQLSSLLVGSYRCVLEVKTSDGTELATRLLTKV